MGLTVFSGYGFANGYCPSPPFHGDTAIVTADAEAFWVRPNPQIVTWPDATSSYIAALDTPNSCAASTALNRSESVRRLNGRGVRDHRNGLASRARVCDGPSLGLEVGARLDIRVMAEEHELANRSADSLLAVDVARRFLEEGHVPDAQFDLSSAS